MEPRSGRATVAVASSGMRDQFNQALSPSDGAYGGAAPMNQMPVRSTISAGAPNAPLPLASGSAFRSLAPHPSQTGAPLGYSEGGAGGLGFGNLSQAPEGLAPTLHLPQQAVGSQPINQPFSAPLATSITGMQQRNAPAGVMTSDKDLQWIPGVQRPGLRDQVINPPVQMYNQANKSTMSYGPSYSMEYKKRSCADKQAIKYTGFLPLEGFQNDDTCRMG